ncbi:hypothetical protein RirG_108550 [Rhizophagus irregularis DAOM 197198w]|uniref:Protein kinase domain-containing protein n=1 Tax=Rhizophagus irregularis (strain DAOM 197198w) TaxID=1432141 RepID=A0A015KKG1_RHIIW|nr:hypothetical protein RirG_108550 [Rhizophagus irregularis DAOM 197198w]
MDLEGTFGNCSDCKRQRSATAWCKECGIAFLKENFRYWTSESSTIDEFIRHTQLNANEIRNVNKRGAFSSIYSATWIEGPRWKLDEQADVWTRSGPIKVILKRLDNSQYMSQEFVNQLYRYHKCLQNEALADYFGMTKDPTSCYMFVMKYFENGNLYSYLEESMGILCWKDIIDMLWSISTSLNAIHKLGLVHGHLHGGNVLVESKANSIDAKIADTGLHGHVDKQISSKQIYGVIPFVAPEIFGGNIPTKESDVYSFGMIMWMLSAGARPFCDRPHDSQLIQEICSGLRPSVISRTPPVFARLMLECLNSDPSDRPTAFQIYESLRNLVSDLSNQIDDAEIPFVNLEKLSLKSSSCHEGAIYFSRLFDSINIKY